MPVSSTPADPTEGGEEPQAEVVSIEATDADDVGGLPAPIENILERLPPEQRREAEIVMRQMVARYSGPVPHAGEMARYKAVDPSFPERFVAMAERQAQHRQQLETMLVTDDFKLKRRGQDYALLVTIIGLAVAVLFAWMEHPVVAGIVAGTTVVGVVTAIVTGRAAENKDDAEGDAKVDES